MEKITSEPLQIDSSNPPASDTLAKTSSNSVKEKHKGEVSKKKKEDKGMDQVLKNLSGLNSPEQKFAALWDKYVETIDENRKLQSSSKQAEKTILLLQREREQYNSEKSKAVLAKSRLESLCRELQKQNKSIKEESLSRLKDEEEKRKEVSAKFQNTVTEITTLMAETNDKNVKLLEDNMETQKKFKTVFEEMDLREKHFEGMHKMMKLELQAAEAKLAKVTLEMTEEKETLLMEKNQMLLKLTEYQTRIRELQAVETNLRSQISMYTDKYEEFQNALTRSNQVFGGFNEEMSKMSKKILKLEKETKAWKSRWEKSNASLLQMAAEKQMRDSEISKLTKKCSLLEELCKTFQQERVNLLSELKEKSQKRDHENEGALTKTDNEMEVQCDDSESGKNCVIATENESNSCDIDKTTCSREPLLNEVTCKIDDKNPTLGVENTNDHAGITKVCQLQGSALEDDDCKTVDSHQISLDTKKVLPTLEASSQSQDTKPTQTSALHSTTGIVEDGKSDVDHVFATTSNDCQESSCHLPLKNSPSEDSARVLIDKKHKDGKKKKK